MTGNRQELQEIVKAQDSRTLANFHRSIWLGGQEELTDPKHHTNSTKELFRTIRALYLSDTESAILNQESGDSESCDSNGAIPRSL